MNQLQKLEIFYQMEKLLKINPFKLPDVRVTGMEKSKDPRVWTVNMEMLVHQPLKYVAFNMAV